MMLAGFGPIDLEKARALASRRLSGHPLSIDQQNLISAALVVGGLFPNEVQALDRAEDLWRDLGESNPSGLDVGAYLRAILKRYA